MELMNNKRIIIVIAVLVALGLLVFFLKGRDSSSRQQVSNVDMVDVVTDFYDNWLQATKAPSTTDPNRKSLAKSPILSETLRDRLVKSLEGPSVVPDPVLCQTKTPENISVMRVYEKTDEAQALVVSKDKKVTEQAIVTLAKLDGGWYIDSIECSAGEFAPEREFSFERDGNLLKASIPKPFNNKNWHMVFEENGELGHVVPLFFDANSQCTNLEGAKAVCKPDQFVETAKVFVQGQMTERGVSVKNLKIAK